MASQISTEGVEKLLQYTSPALVLLALPMLRLHDINVRSTDRQFDLFFNLASPIRVTHLENQSSQKYFNVKSTFWTPRGIIS